MRSTRTTDLVLPAIVLGALLLSSCGSTDEPTTTTAATSSPASSASASDQALEPGNSADIGFATGMIPHHGQAIQMADLAAAKASSPKVKDLATRVKTAQAPEITTLSGLLSSWGEPVPEASGHSGSMAGMDHGDAGMMTSKQMDELEAASGAEFDRMWVDMMITHHEGAVAMSKTEISDGSHEAIKQLAQSIAISQTKEIAELQSLRTDLS